MAYYVHTINKKFSSSTKRIYISGNNSWLVYDVYRRVAAQLFKDTPTYRRIFIDMRSGGKLNLSLSARYGNESNIYIITNIQDSDMPDIANWLNHVSPVDYVIFMHETDNIKKSPHYKLLPEKVGKDKAGYFVICNDIQDSTYISILVKAGIAERKAYNVAGLLDYRSDLLPNFLDRYANFGDVAIDTLVQFPSISFIDTLLRQPKILLGQEVESKELRRSVRLLIRMLIIIKFAARNKSSNYMDIANVLKVSQFEVERAMNVRQIIDIRKIGDLLTTLATIEYNYYPVGSSTLILIMWRKCLIPKFRNGIWGGDIYNVFGDN